MSDSSSPMSAEAAEWQSGWVPTCNQTVYRHTWTEQVLGTERFFPPLAPQVPRVGDTVVASTVRGPQRYRVIRVEWDLTGALVTCWLGPEAPSVTLEQATAAKAE
jgi:hypothetical protein